MTQAKPLTDDERIQRIVQLFKEAKSGSYSTVASRLREVRELVHEEIAERLSKPLNEHLAQIPHATLHEKQDLARFANAEMRCLGVAIRCPKTGLPAMLHANSGHDATKGRFQFSVIDHKPHPTRTVTSQTLPMLVLMPHFTRKEPLVDYWAKTLGHSQPGGKRR